MITLSYGINVLRRSLKVSVAVAVPAIRKMGLSKRHVGVKQLALTGVKHGESFRSHHHRHQIFKLVHVETPIGPRVPNPQQSKRSRQKICKAKDLDILGNRLAIQGRQRKVFKVKRRVVSIPTKTLVTQSAIWNQRPSLSPDALDSTYTDCVRLRNW